MSLKYYLVSLSSDICEDDFEKGEGDSTGCGHCNTPIGRTFNTLTEMLKYLASMFGLPEKESDYNVESNVLHTCKTVANHSEAQNGGWFEPTTAELTAWKRGKLKLYSENFSVRFVRCI